jgi:hypothetical protein
MMKSQPLISLLGVLLFITFACRTPQQAPLPVTAISWSEVPVHTLPYSIIPLIYTATPSYEALCQRLRETPRDSLSRLYSAFPSDGAWYLSGAGSIDSTAHFLARLPDRGGYKLLIYQYLTGGTDDDDLFYLLQTVDSTNQCVDRLVIAGRPTGEDEDFSRSFAYDTTGIITLTDSLTLYRDADEGDEEDTTATSEGVTYGDISSVYVQRYIVNEQGRFVRYYDKANETVAVKAHWDGSDTKQYCEKGTAKDHLRDGYWLVIDEDAGETLQHLEKYVRGVRIDSLKYANDPYRNLSIAMERDDSAYFDLHLKDIKDVNHRFYLYDERWRTLLQVACDHNRAYAIRQLLARKDIIPQATEGKEYADNITDNILYHAFQGHCDLDILDLLLEHGVDVNRIWTPRGETALSWCALNGEKEYADYLLRHGARVDGAGIMDSDSLNVGSPIDNAVSQADTAIAKLLMKYGAKLQVKGMYGTPLEYADKELRGKMRSTMLRVLGHPDSADVARDKKMALCKRLHTFAWGDELPLDSQSGTPADTVWQAVSDSLVHLLGNDELKRCQAIALEPYGDRKFIILRGHWYRYDDEKDDYKTSMICLLNKDYKMCNRQMIDSEWDEWYEGKKIHGQVKSRFSKDHQFTSSFYYRSSTGEKINKDRPDECSYIYDDYFVTK